MEQIRKAHVAEVMGSTLFEGENLHTAFVWEIEVQL